MDTSKSCPWCSTPITAGATTCPNCGAVVEGEAGADVPGVTEIDAKASLGADEGQVPDAFDPASWLTAGRGGPVDHDAVAPPSEAVRAEMHRMELEAEIANAGGMVMGATDDVARDAPLPSEEAIEALEKGLIQAPTKELAERAKGLEVDEDEQLR
jgi:hypothetical protein